MDFSTWNILGKTFFWSCKHISINFRRRKFCFNFLENYFKMAQFWNKQLGGRGSFIRAANALWVVGVFCISPKCFSCTEADDTRGEPESWSWSQNRDLSTYFKGWKIKQIVIEKSICSWIRSWPYLSEDDWLLTPLLLKFIFWKAVQLLNKSWSRFLC